MLSRGHFCLEKAWKRRSLLGLIPWRDGVYDDLPKGMSREEVPEISEKGAALGGGGPVRG